MHIAIVSTRETAALTRASVRHAVSVCPSARALVLDVDGGYESVRSEDVLSPADLGLGIDELHRAAARHEPRALARALYPAAVRAALARATGDGDGDGDPTVLVLQPGVLLLQPPTVVLNAAASDGLGLVARAPQAIPHDDRWPTVLDLSRAGGYAPQLLAITGLQPELIALWELLAAGPDDRSGRWLDVVAAQLRHRTVRDAAVLLSSWSLLSTHLVDPGSVPGTARLVLDGRDVVAVDLTAFDPRTPWLLDTELSGDPRARLSEHPALAQFVATTALELLADTGAWQGDRAGAWDLSTTSLGTVIDPPLREIYRSADTAPDGAADSPPDPFDTEAATALRTWLTEPAADGGPGRYLCAIHRTRPDLQRTFPSVPGRDSAGFLAWARAYGTSEGYPPELLEPAVAAPRASRAAPSGRLTPGVNVVGFLRGELGIGESARLVVSALGAAGVPHTTLAVDEHLASRQSARYDDEATATAGAFDTTLICVNADLTPAVAATIPDSLGRGYRIGMWYWEVEDFPASQHGGFEHVDEVWVASDFVRGAIEAHSPVPVRTVTPPLPQRGAPPTITRAELGLPERPFFLFSFDYLSTAERKNPIGLVDAFTTAFAPGEGPLMVIKSINADRRPGEAERLRLRAADAPDVFLLEDYLDATHRDALVALCDCYVSLHRSEGLGLTMAEAMAWGKPVIATGYSGNLQFMTEQNSFLVPWTPTTIPPGAEPYPAGGIWADPDLGAAARLMRSVIDEPEVAAARGARAAADIEMLHSPAAAGARIAAALAESAPRRRARSRIALTARLEKVARRARATLR